MTEQVQPQPQFQTMNDAVEALNRFNTTVVAKNPDMKLVSLSAQYEDGKGGNTGVVFKQDTTSGKIDALFTNRSESFNRACDVHGVSSFEEVMNKFDEENEIFYAEEDSDQPPF